MDTMYLPRRNKLVICILFLHLLSVKCHNHTYTIIGLFPINSTPANESANLVSAVKTFEGKYLLPNGSIIDIQLFNNSNQADLTMKVMLDTFTQPSDLTAIIGPGSEKAIHSLDQFLNTIPEKVLHLVYNPVIDTKGYLHNMAPSVSSIVDLLIELLVNMKWNYVAIMKDSTEFSKLSGKIFQEKAQSNRICIGLVEVINLNENIILNKIEAAKIRGVLVFGKEDIVRSVSRKVEQRDFRFIFVSNENWHVENTFGELPDLSLQVMWNGFYNETSSNNHLKYIYDSVDMALKWFSICQDLSKCRDLRHKEIIPKILDIYQKMQNKQYKVGSYNEKLVLNPQFNKVESFCKKECEKCLALYPILNPYYLKNGTYYIVLVIPLHRHDINNHFLCSRSISTLESVDFVEAAIFAIKTCANPHLGLIVIDSCEQPLIITEQLIHINYTNVLGVIGGFYSLTTIPAAEVLTRLQIPQISYGAESHALSDQGRFPYFQRTTISMEEKTKAIILLCQKIGWKAINIMYNKEPFGISGRSLLMKYAEIHGICVVNDIAVELEENIFQIYLNQLRKTSKVKVIITFFLLESYKRWLYVLNDDLADNEFLIIDGYGMKHKQVQKILKKHFNSLVIIEVNKPINQEFLEYYKNLQKSEIEKNPWAKEFIEKKNKCHFEGSFNTEYQTECRYKYQVDSVTTYHDLFIKAVYALVNATLRATNDFVDFKNKNAQKIVEEIRKTRLNISGKEQRLFDDEGKSQIQLFKLMKVKAVDPLVEYEKIAVYESEAWEIDNWSGISQFTSTCISDDSCTICPEKNETAFLVLLILDVILGVIIVVFIGVFIWRKKNSISAYCIRIRDVMNLMTCSGAEQN